MENITQQQVKQSVADFLALQYNKKTEKIQKKLDEAHEKNNAESIQKLSKELSDIRKKYELENWMSHAANSMAKQLNFGTHISKGVHPAAQGDNVAFTVRVSHNIQLIGSHTIQSNLLDANGNAAALPLAAFFDFDVCAEQNIKIRDLIRCRHQSLENAFSNNRERSDEYLQAFFSALSNDIKEPATSECNKQLLWPVDTESYQYKNIIPLYPSVLTHEIYQKINNLRYSEANKVARDNRFKPKEEHTEYISIRDLAVIKLGGTKPQNISLLMSKQGGRNYLLPSLPPNFKRSAVYNISPSNTSFFNKNLQYQCRKTLNALINLIKAPHNNVNIRDARKEIVDNILINILSLASSIQEYQEVGWSKDSNLNYDEALWLDPERASLEGEEQFKFDRENKDWRAAIAKSFAGWLNHVLRNELKSIKEQIADETHTEWQREMEEMVKRSQRLGQEVFL